jgi:surface polysaccharide O-acyltransferase-like enzyme
MFPGLAVAAGALRDEFDPAITGGLTGLSLAYCLWEALIGVALVITVLVWFRDRFDRQGTLLQKMSLAAYSVYVFHPLIIVPLALWLSSIQIPLELKFLLVTPLAVALCYLIGYYLRRLPGLRRIL